MNKGIEPSTRSAATMMPQRAITPAFSRVARHDVETASDALTLQSTSIGSETTLTAITSAANASPMTVPKTISAHPSGVVNTRVTNSEIECGEYQTKLDSHGGAQKPHSS